jgi:hypothetical protein
LNISWSSVGTPSNSAITIVGSGSPKDLLEIEKISPKSPSEVG